MTKNITVYHYDAFSDVPNMGNPAGVVLNGDSLTDTEMQLIAQKVGFNETAFPVKSEVADIRIRFFTPGHEINLCGHATMATIFALKTRGLLGDKTELTIETAAGVLAISTETYVSDKLYIKMQQAAPQFHTFNGSKQALMQSIGLEESDLAEQLPIVYGSTGTWTLLVPIKSLSVFQSMCPQNNLFPSILSEMPQASIHPFCLETHQAIASMHARHFSSPFSGTIEDPVTGTASGVMGVYYANYIDKEKKDRLNLIVEQGQELGRNGRVLVQVDHNNGEYEVYITGNAVYVNEFTIQL